MHRLRLLYALCFALSSSLASGTPSTGNFGFGPPLKTIVSFGGAIAWLPAVSGSPAIPLPSQGNNSLLVPRILRARIDRNEFSNAQSELIIDDSLIGNGISIAPTPPSPIP